ncbi:MAG: SDR family NAD(P)-dependent oxidoreductase [Woeseiaceae bacterium]
MDLSGKVCLVTGASRGIGAAIAERFAEAGATIVIHYGSDRKAAEAVFGRLPGDHHVVLGTDLSEPDTVADYVDSVMSKVDRLDVLVNNAGIYTDHPLLKSERDEWLESWNKILAVNLLSPAVLCHAAGQIMAEQGGGRIINIGSRGAFRGEPVCPAYGASKAGLHAMSQSLAVALGPANIQVFAIAPGFTETDMVTDLLASEEGAMIKAQSPMNRVARPAEIAETACFLAATDAEFLTGGIFDVNGASYLRS